MNHQDESRLAGLLKEKQAKGKDLRFCVVGAGHGGLCMAGHLGLQGFRVRLYNRSEEHLEGVRWHGGVLLSGEVCGFGAVELATHQIGNALAGADVIMVVTPANAHRPLAQLMAPHLEDGQILVLNPGRTGGALEVDATLRESGCKALVLTAEAQTFLYASRSLSRSEGRIFKIKHAVPLATIPSFWIPEALAVIHQAFPGFIAGTNVLTTSFDNIGAVFHPALTLLNAGWIEATGGDFEYYLEGVTPSVGRVLESIDAERIRVGTGLGLQCITARQWLYRSYDSTGANLCEAIRNTSSYAGIKAPVDIQHRYIFEDVPMSLVPMSSLGAQLGIATPTIDMIIRLGCLLHGRDFFSEGRTVERLGLAGKTVKEIRQQVAGMPSDSKTKEGTTP